MWIIHLEKTLLFFSVSTVKVLSVCKIVPIILSFYMICIWLCFLEWERKSGEFSAIILRMSQRQGWLTPEVSLCLPLPQHCVTLQLQFSWTCLCVSLSSLRAASVIHIEWTQWLSVQLITWVSTKAKIGIQLTLQIPYSAYIRCT